MSNQEPGTLSGEQGTMFSPERIKLTVSQRLTHFAAPLVMIALATLPLLWDLYPVGRRPHALYGWGWLLVGGLAFIRQWSVLRFRVVRTESDASTNFRTVSGLAGERGWTLSTRTFPTQVVASAPGPLLITVLFEESRVLVNCISDPNQPRMALGGPARVHEIVKAVSGTEES